MMEGMTMTRDEYIEKCKQEARGYLNAGELESAVAVMMTDLQKRDDTAFKPGSMLSTLGLFAAASGDYEQVSRYIEGFR
jgi:hypothetical protein